MRCAVAWLVMTIVSTAVFAEDADFYLDVNCVESGGSVVVNGFHLYSELNLSATGSSATYLVTPYLVDGENVVELRYLPTAEVTKNSAMTVTVVSVPPGSKREGTLEKVVVKWQAGSRMLSLSPSNQPQESVRFLIGGTQLNDGRLVFELRDKRSELGVSLSPEKALKRPPSSLEYTGLRATVKNLRLHFFKIGGPQHVVFGGVKLDKGNGAVPLTRSQVIRGLEWYREGPFDGVFLESDEPVDLFNVRLFEIEGDVSEKIRFKASIKSKWCWQGGEEIGVISKTIEDEVWQAVSVIHEQMAKGRIDDLARLFRTKYVDYALAMHVTPEEVEKTDKENFAETMKSPGWEVFPIDRRDFRLFKINKTVLVAERLNGDDLISSKPMNGQGFAIVISPYFSKINGRWELAR